MRNINFLVQAKDWTRNSSSSTVKMGATCYSIQNSNKKRSRWLALLIFHRNDSYMMPSEAIMTHDMTPIMATFVLSVVWIGLRITQIFRGRVIKDAFYALWMVAHVVRDVNCKGAMLPRIYYLCSKYRCDVWWSLDEGNELPGKVSKEKRRERWRKDWVWSFYHFLLYEA